METGVHIPYGVKCNDFFFYSMLIIVPETVTRVHTLWVLYFILFCLPHIFKNTGKSLTLKGYRHLSGNGWLKNRCRPKEIECSRWTWASDKHIQPQDINSSDRRKRTLKTRGGGRERKQIEGGERVRERKGRAKSWEVWCLAGGWP